MKKILSISFLSLFLFYDTASVSGWYFAHPQSQYFNVGKITDEQVADYAKRTGRKVEW